MQEFNKPFLFTTLILTSLSSYGALALPTPNAWCPTPLLPRVSVTGLSGDATTGALDAMVPMLGNVDSMIYGDAQGKVGNDNAWMGGIGAGYRQVVNPSDILGAYLFVDRNVTADKNTFWVLSPGVESMGYLWDVRANGYFPISSKQVFDHSAWGDELGLAQYVTFSGHQQFDRLFNFYEEVGPGADGEIGRIFPCLNRFAVYGGGYFFNLRDASNIKGVEGRIEYPINRYFTAMVNDTYDNQQHNTIMAGVRVSIGKPKVCPGSFDIHQRMLDPIERGLGTLNTGSNIPSVKVRDNGRNLLQRDNIWFFTQNGAAVGSPAVLGCGTAEHPCFGNQFTQANVDAINAQAPNANFYFNTGTYPLPASSFGRIALNGGQSIYGRRPDYKLAAQGSERPVFIGGFDLNQGNNTLDSFQILNDGNQISGLFLTDARNITMNNLLVGGTDKTSGYIVGINMSNAQNVVLNNSTVNGFDQQASIFSANAFAIQMLDGSELTINHSNINATAQALGIGGATTAGAIGIRGDQNSVVNLNNSTVNAIGSVSGPSTSMNTQVTGISMTQGSTVNLNNSTVNANSEITGTSIGLISSSATGINLFANSTADINHSTVNANGEVNANGTNLNNFVNGITASTMSNVDVSGSKINADAVNLGTSTATSNAQVTGITASSGTTLTVNNSKINAMADVFGNANFINVRAEGLVLANGTADIIGSQINSAANGVDTSGSAIGITVAANGLNATQNETVTLTNSEINAAAAGTGFGPNDIVSTSSIGILANNNSTLTIRNTKAKTNSFAFGAGVQTLASNATGLNAFNSSVVNIFNSDIDANAVAAGSANFLNGTSTGIFGQNASDINVTNSNINANTLVIGNSFGSLSALSTGIVLATNSDLNLTNSQVSANAMGLGVGIAGSQLLVQSRGLNLNAGLAQIDNSTISSSANLWGTADNLAVTSDGARVTDGTLIIINSTIAAQAGGIANSGSNLLAASASGVSGDSSGVTLEGTRVTANSIALGQTTTTLQSTAIGASIFNGGLTIDNSQINAAANAIGNAGQILFARADGVSVTGGSVASITNSSIFASSFTLGTASLQNTSLATGVNVGDSEANISNSLIAANAIAIGDGTGGTQTAEADGISANNSAVTVSNSFIEAGAFSNFGAALARGIDSSGSTIDAQNNTFLVIAAGPTGGVSAQGIVDNGGSTIIDINNNYFLFPIEFANNNWNIKA